jgi:hypothetical protein
MQLAAGRRGSDTTTRNPRNFQAADFFSSSDAEFKRGRLEAVRDRDAATPLFQDPRGNAMQWYYRDIGAGGIVFCDYCCRCRCLHD